MASLRIKPRSPYFFACYTGPDGNRVQRSTKIPNFERSRRKAQAVADLWEKAARLGATRRLSEAQARRVIGEIYEAVNDEPLPSATTRDFLTTWVNRRKIDTSPRTYGAYSQVIRDFLASLGERSSRDISQVGKRDVAKYRDAVLERTTAATANKSLKYLRVALGAAYKDGLAQENAASRVDTLKRRHGESGKRRPFTLDELRSVLSHASPEWKGIILFGLYTGQRLKDIARLTWQNIDTEHNELHLVTAKTGRRMHIPLAKPVTAHLASMDSSDKADDPLFPSAYSIAMKPRDDSRLSQQFYSILLASGLVRRERTHLKEGEGRNARRTINEVTFHSLRHTSNSLLKNAGVSDSIVMELIGHETEDASQRYTHISRQAKRTAIAKLPDITKIVEDP